MKISEWLKEKKMTQRDLRERMMPKPTEAHLSRMISGKVSISLARALEIKKLTGGKVKPEDWVRE